MHSLKLCFKSTNPLLRRYQRARQTFKVEMKKKVMGICCSLTHPFNSESQSSTDHTYVQDSLLPDTYSRSIAANERPPTPLI